MISLEIWLLFLGYTVPLVISPGPGNTILTSMGARFGVKGSGPFWLGFEAGNVALCLIYGFGLGQLAHAYPLFGAALKWTGIVYLLYLAWTFIRSTTKSSKYGENDHGRLGLADGFVSVLLNPKIHSMVLAMFTQFLDGGHLVGQVTQLTLAFLVVSIICHFLWIYLGATVLGRLRSEKEQRIQGWAFALCMIVVAGFMVRG